MSKKDLNVEFDKAMNAFQDAVKELYNAAHDVSEAPEEEDEGCASYIDDAFKALDRLNARALTTVQSAEERESVVTDAAFVAGVLVGALC